MKFSAEIEKKFQEELNNTDDELKKTELIRRKTIADDVLDRFYPDKENINYGSIKKKNNKDYFAHTLNTPYEKLQISIDDMSNIYQFLGYFAWYSLEEILKKVFAFKEKLEKI